MMRKLLIALNVATPLAALGLWVSGQFWLGLLILFGVHMLSLAATLIPGCAWWGPVETRCNPGDSGVWLTIDDGPDPDDTPEILKILEAASVRVTFFLIGERALRWPHLVRAILEGGHAIGNHTMTHPRATFWCLGPRRLAAEIEQGQAAIAAAGGKAPRCFRAPVGMRNLFLHPILKRSGLKLVAWSVRGLDGVSTDRRRIVQRIERGLEPGAIVLMHEGQRDAAGNSVIIDTLPMVVRSIEERGLCVIDPVIAESDFPSLRPGSG